MKVTIEINSREHMLLAIQKNLNSIEWAIREAPVRHVQSLISTKSILKEIHSQIIKTKYGEKS